MSHNEAEKTKHGPRPVLARPVSMLGHSASSVARRMPGYGHKPLDSSAPHCYAMRASCGLLPSMWGNWRCFRVAQGQLTTSVCGWHLSCRATLVHPVTRLEKAVSTQQHCAASRDGQV